MAFAIIVALVVGASALDCNAGSIECPASHPEVEDDVALLSLRSSHRKFSSEESRLSEEAEVLNWGNKTVIAFSSDDGFTEEYGWYGDSVADMDSSKQMAFANGSLLPQQFFMRPVPGSDASGCIKYGQQVVIAYSKTEDDSGRCGWYGCKVAQVLDDTLVFMVGGKDPQAFFFLSTSGKVGCIHYGDQVAMASSRDSPGDILYKNSENVMSWGKESPNNQFFLRPPAAGRGPNKSVCDDVNATMTRVIDVVMGKAQEKLDNVTANATPIDKTKYWWNIDFTGPIFGIHWKNNAGRTVKADVLTNITASADDWKTTDCVINGSDTTFSTKGSLELLWTEPAGGSLELFYQGFIPFIHITKTISLKLSNLKMGADLFFKFSFPSLTKMCIDIFRGSGCELTADVKVTGAPNFAKRIEKAINASMVEASKTMCDKMNDYGTQIENTCYEI